MLNFTEYPPLQPETSTHQPVMVSQVLDLLLKSSPDDHTLHDTLVDGTIGGGGHAQAVLEILSVDGRLIGFDRDPEALAKARIRLQDDPRLELHQASYADVEDFVGPESVSGILLDLGISTDQLNSNRGFAFSTDSPLDLRFDPAGRLTGDQVINRYSAAKLREVFFHYGEEPLSPRIARGIVEARKHGGIHTTGQLADIVRKSVPERFRSKALARVFQAIRIEVNSEIAELERGLESLWKVLKVDGVFAVIAYHSIEDRRVKRFFAEKVKGCICPPRLPVCACGRKPTARLLTHAAVKPSAKEIRINPRSRSARLRAAVKIAPPQGN
jgi:16S rRNA (cytosine1402-N4)-methyltransferase